MQEEFKNFIFKIFNFLIPGLAAAKIKVAVNIFPLIRERGDQRHGISFVQGMATAQQDVFLRVFHKLRRLQVVLPANAQRIMPVNGAHGPFIPDIVPSVVNGKDRRGLFPVCKTLQQAEGRGQNGTVGNAVCFGKGIYGRQINMQRNRNVFCNIIILWIQIAGKFPGMFRKGTDEFFIPLLFFLIFRRTQRVLDIVIIIKDAVLFRL